MPIHTLRPVTAAYSYNVIVHKQDRLFWFGLVWFKYRAPVPKLPLHLPLDGGSGPRLQIMLPVPACSPAACLLCLHDTPREQ